MPNPERTYELFAIRYATRDGRRRDHFIGGDPHDAPMPMDYFVWVAVSGRDVFVIDTGFTREVSDKRKREYLRCPIDSLALLGVEAKDVKNVILTHLHYDHAGNYDKFPNATFHLQEKEIHYATGRYMHYAKLSHAFEVEDICGVVRLNYAHRVHFCRERETIAPGIEVINAGGHSAGLQFVKVFTQRGWVVVASDVTHFYENMISLRPFSTAFHVGEMLEGFDLLRAEAAGDDYIVPGHDPKVMQLYPAMSEATRGIVVRLDVNPRAA
jgi:glyoxylase-like metal-dependent hydrolase (beta-lactamase superfamily II)